MPFRRKIYRQYAMRLMLMECFRIEFSISPSPVCVCGGSALFDMCHTWKCSCLFYHNNANGYAHVLLCMWCSSLLMPVIICTTHTHTQNELNWTERKRRTESCSKFMILHFIKHFGFECVPGVCFRPSENCLGNVFHNNINRFECWQMILHKTQSDAITRNGWSLPLSSNQKQIQWRATKTVVIQLLECFIRMGREINEIDVKLPEASAKWSDRHTVVCFEIFFLSHSKWIRGVHKPLSDAIYH